MLNVKRRNTPAVAVQRKSEAYEKIQTKIAALRDFRRTGVPEGAFIPKSLEQFRRWNDEQRNLREIGSKSTLYQPCYQKERVEILNLIKLLAQPEPDVNKRTNGLARLRQEKRELKFMMRQMAGEIHKTRQELQSVQLDNERLTQRLQDRQQEISKLVAQLKKQTGLYPVK
jgi:chromosome segregation ATPase